MLRPHKKALAGPLFDLRSAWLKPEAFRRGTLGNGLLQLSYVRRGYAPMSKRRVLTAYAVIALVSVGSLFCIAAPAERWPFSAYRMYADVKREPRLELLRLFGVTGGDNPVEIPLLAFQYIQPFDQSRQRLVFTKISKDPQRQDLLPEALLDCLLRYESLRQDGRHSGPPLQGVRLYRLSWELDPWARNVDQPNRKELLQEATLPVKEPQ